MTNLAVIWGTGYFGEDIFHKFPWIKHIDANVYAISRIDPNIHHRENVKKMLPKFSHDLLNRYSNELKDYCSVMFIYDSPQIKKTYSKDEIKDLEKWIGVSFNYLASFDRRFYDKSNLKDKRDKKLLLNFLAGLTSFLKKFFLENKIDIFLNTIEDDICSVMCFYVAIKLNVKIIGLMGSRFPKKGVMFCENFSNVIEWNEDSINSGDIKSLYLNSRLVGEDISINNKEKWNVSSLPHRLNGLRYIYNYQRYVKQVLKFYPNEKFIYQELSLLKEVNDFFSKYSRLNLVKILKKPVDFSEKYFMFPLHYFEDAQITFREPFIDQYEIIEKISRSLPIDHFLYVKPHPHYFGTDIRTDDLFKISKLQNVKLISPDVSPFELIKNSVGVITINSTTGFEALINDKPVITWGHDFYCNELVCNVIRDVNDLPEKVIQISNKQYGSDKTEIQNFIKTVYDNTLFLSPKIYRDGIFIFNENEGKIIAKTMDSFIGQI